MSGSSGGSHDLAALGEQLRVLHGDAELRAEAADQLVLAGREGVGAVVAEVDRAKHSPAAAPHRHGQPAPHQAAVGEHAVGAGALVA